MPQIMPLNWLLLLLLFSLIMYWFSSLIFFHWLPKSSMNKNKFFKSYKTNWKW